MRSTIYILCEYYLFLLKIKLNFLDISSNKKSDPISKGVIFFNLKIFVRWNEYNFLSLHIFSFISFFIKTLWYITLHNFKRYNIFPIIYCKTPCHFLYNQNYFPLDVAWMVGRNECHPLHGGSILVSDMILLWTPM